MKWLLPLAVLGFATVLGCTVDENRFPGAEPRMPMVTYYELAPQSPLGPTIKEGAIGQDPQNPGGESPV